MPTPATPPRPDASMSLLRDLVETSVDPGYRRAAEQGRRPRARALLVTTLVLAGALIGAAILADSRQAPQAALERRALMDQAKEQQATNVELRSRLAQLEREVETLETEALGSESSPASRMAVLTLVAGSGRVQGPGVVVVVDDSTTLSGTQAEVIDQDLRQLVNGLWSAGAEAVAINGHRLSARTAIRGAGRAITVDYTSLTRPYTVESIGDPKTLPARLAATQGGRYWAYLEQNYGLRYDVSTARSLVLAQDPGLRLSKAGPKR